MRRPATYILLWVVLLLLGLVFFRIGSNFLELNARYARDGEVTTGTVTGKDFTEEEDRERRRTEYNYFINYTFPRADGSMAEGRASVTRSVYDTLQPQQPVEVEYLPGDESLSRLVGSTDGRSGYILTGIGVLFLIAGGAVLWVDVRARRRISRLLSSGVVATGTITALVPSTISINKTQLWRLAYEFKDMLGRTFEGQSEVMQPREIESCKPGDSGSVRYDQHNPAINLWVGSA